MKGGVAFTKYSGCGNDFVLIDNRSRQFSHLQEEEIVKQMCHRHEGIGADGIIFLESDGGKHRMRIFQPDGKEVEMCGNGLRCLGHFIHTLDPSQKEFAVATMHSEARVSVSSGSNDVAVHMAAPGGLTLHKMIDVSGTKVVVHCVNTGVPHAVLFVKDIGSGDMLLAKQLRHHQEFHPEGTNVNFVQILSKKRLAIRTYERGVEAETLACGTGAAAAAILAKAIHRCEGTVEVITKSTEVLRVTHTHDHLILEGPARPVFSGEI